MGVNELICVRTGLPLPRGVHGPTVLVLLQVNFAMSEDTTLADLLQLNLHNFEDEVHGIVDKAIKESGMEKVTGAQFRPCIAEIPALMWLCAVGTCVPAPRGWSPHAVRYHGARSLEETFLLLPFHRT